MSTDTEQYLRVMTFALAIGTDLVSAIMNHAKADLTPEQYAELQQQWDRLVARTARNAGLIPPAA